MGGREGEGRRKVGMEVYYGTKRIRATFGAGTLILEREALILEREGKKFRLTPKLKHEKNLDLSH